MENNSYICIVTNEYTLLLYTLNVCLQVMWIYFTYFIHKTLMYAFVWMYNVWNGIVKFNGLNYDEWSE